ncbi:MAG: DUF6575 domain-containing protein [Methylococcaceae bacterium]
MFYLPKNTYLGKLEVKDIFEFYDIPRLFTCKNKTGQHYLALSIDEYEEQLIWLYLGISVDRLNLLINNKIDLLYVFKNPENGFLFKVKTTYLSEHSELESIFPEQLTEEELPCENTYLTCETVKYNYGLGEIDPQESALASKREVCNLHFYPSNGYKSELDIKILGKTLISLQETIDSIGQKHLGKTTIKGKIPIDTLQQTALNVCQIFEGSFGIQLKSSYIENDIFNYSLVSDSIAEAFNLFMLKDNEMELKNRLHELKGRVASKYQQFLKDLLSIESDLKIEWGSPKNKRGGSFILEHKVIRKTFDIINKLEISEKDNISIEGKLIGCNVRTKTYEILSLNDEAKFSGRISDNADIQHPIINDIYQVEIEHIIKTKLSSGEEKNEWNLIRLIPVVK